MADKTDKQQANPFDGFKRFVRVQKQDIKEKLKKSGSPQEDTGFKEQLDAFDAYRSATSSVATGLKSFVDAETTTGAASKKLSEEARALGTQREGTQSTDTLNHVAMALDQIDEHRQAMLTEVRKDVQGPMEVVVKEFVDPMADGEKSYRRVRLEHDAIHSSLEAQLQKGGKPERTQKLQSEYDEIHAELIGIQQQLVTAGNSLQQAVEKRYTHELIVMCRQLHGFYGQAYRIMSELMPALEREDKRVSGIPDVKPIEWPKQTHGLGFGSSKADE